LFKQCKPPLGLGMNLFNWVTLPKIYYEKIAGDNIVTNAHLNFELLIMGGELGILQ
jgi:hypothetical protein